MRQKLKEVLTGLPNTLCDDYKYIAFDADDVSTFNKEDVCYALSRFICECRKESGAEFPPRTLTHIILMM